jgi:hypothetical protein
MRVLQYYVSVRGARENLVIPKFSLRELFNRIVINNSLVLSSLHQTLQVWNERSSSLTIGYQNISESNRIGIYLEEKSIGLDQL